MKIAVLILCYNEELTIGKVINDFKAELPEADIYVYNNNSKDKTVEIAKRNGAIVKNEYKQGRGNVIRSMFYDIDADVFLIISPVACMRYCFQLIFSVPLLTTMYIKRES